MSPREWRAGAAALFVLLWTGCGGGRSAGDAADEADAGMKRAEQEFTPSEFDRAPDMLLKDAAADTAVAPPDMPPPSPATEPELTPGFRVQIYSSSDIDEANAIKTAAESTFTGERFYIVYDPPMYKVRAGDFPSRHEADRFARVLREGGYNDAWIVPDRVARGLPPR